MSVLNIQTEREISANVVALTNNVRFLQGLESGNLFNKRTQKDNTSLAGTGGTETALSNYATSDFIPINRAIYPYLAFKSRNSATTSQAPYRAAFYGRYHNFLQNVTFTNGKCEILEDAWYIKFTYPANTTSYRNHDALLYYADKILDWHDIPYRPVGYKRVTDKNLIIEDDLIVGYKNGFDGSANYIIDAPTTRLDVMTAYIPVLPNMEYVFGVYFEEVSNDSKIYCFDKSKNYIAAINTSVIINGVFTTPEKCYYLSFNYYAGNIDYRDKPFFLCEKKGFNFEIGSKIADDTDLVARYTGKIEQENLNYTTRIIGLYESYAVITAPDGHFHYSNTGMDGKFTTVQINSTNFPGLATGSLPQFVLFFRTNNGIRSLVFFDKNQIYCSTTGPFAGFEVPNIWDLKGNKSWRVADNDTNPAGTRYRKYFPSDIATRPDAFLWHNGPVWVDGIGGQYARGVLFANYTNAYGNIPTPSCLFYTEDGKNIYVQYEFGIYQYKYKLAGSDTEKTSVNYGYGDTVTPSTMAGALSSVTIKKRWNILPTGETPNPTTLFDYSTPISVQSTSGDAFVLSDASGFSVGDTIVLQGSATGDFAKILNNDASATNGGDNVFVIKAKSGNSVTIADAIGNPKNNLMCRHIHGVADFGQGVCVYTGEEYPESWYIYLAPYTNSTNDGTNMDNERWETSVVRLNSSINAFQRSLGVYLRPDGKMVFVSDSNAPYIKKAEALGKEIKMGGHGVFVTEIADIDDAANNISKIDALNDIYCLYKLGNILFISDYNGNTYYSKDEGETWVYICRGASTKNLLVGFDRYKRRFVFNTQRKEQFVIELK